jgi:hypothetical protein
MAKGDRLIEEEQVVRAFFLPHWDEINKRATPSAFLDKNGVSVSRLARLSYDAIVAIYRANFDGKELQGGQFRYVRQTGRLSVAQVYELSDARIDTRPPQDPPSVCALVVEDPIEEEPPRQSNPAHALVEGWDRATKTERKPNSSEALAGRLCAARRHLADFGSHH